MRKRSLFLIILIILCEMLFAIGSHDSEGEITTLKIGVFEDIETGLLAIIESDGFKKKFPNIELKSSYSNLVEHHNRIFSQLESGEALNDIEAIDFNYIPRLVQSGGFTDLGKEPYCGKNAAGNLALCSISAAMQEDGRIIAFPLSIDPAVLYYRKSIAEKAGINFTELSCWDEYIDKAEKLVADKNNDGKVDQYALTHPLDVSVLLLNNENTRWILDGKPLQPVERFKSVLSICRKIRDSGIDADFLPWTGNWITSFRKGTVVTMFSGASFGNELKNWMAPVSSGDGDWRITFPPPESYVLLGGNYLGIPGKIENKRKKMAWDIVKYLCTEQEAQILFFKMTEKFPALVSTYNNPVMSEPVPYFGGQKIYQVFKDIAEKIPSRYVYVNDAYAIFNDAYAIDIFNYAIKSVVYNKASIDEAYILAKEKIEKIINSDLTTTK